MEIFVTNDELSVLEDFLPTLHDLERVSMLVNLAWHLRQRDTHRALSLTQEASNLLIQLPDSIKNIHLAEIRLLNARMMLIRGESDWLFAHLDSAQQLGETALLEFALLSGLDSELGCADAHYLLANVAVSRGVMSVVESEIGKALLHTKNANDKDRELLVQSLLAVQMALRNLPQALTLWADTFSLKGDTNNTAISVCDYEFSMYTSTLSGDFGPAAEYGIHAYELALQTGQIRRAIIAATNVGDAFNSLNDHQTALAWIETGHVIARKVGWPSIIGSCLIQMAETLRRMGRLDAANELLIDAIPIVSSAIGSRPHLMALRYLGDLSLDRKDYSVALTCFCELQEHSDDHSQTDFRIGARRGRAHALSWLNQPKEALRVALDALSLAQESADSYRKIDVLRVLAAIYLRHKLPQPNGMKSVSASVHYLKIALETAESIQGYIVPGELFEEMADAYAELGLYSKAFKLSRKAIEANEKIYSQEAANRATAMQLSHQTEQMRAEGKHLRELAEGEAERAEMLQQTGAILELLGAIGQEITASLDANAVFQTLNRHVHGLLHVTAFVIYLMDADQQSITSTFGVEDGHPIKPDTVMLSDTASRSARCIKERREILFEFSPDEEIIGLIPGTERVLSMLFAPLVVGEKILGVMTIQSSQYQAYGEREKMIFRSLSAYGAIALSNADAYLRLKETQTYLLAQEKLAALGSLVAGVAHELNTPIGNCLLVASTVQDNSKNMIDKLSTQNLRRSELDLYCNDMKASSEIMMRSLASAASLISSFKQVAVDRTSEHRRIFDLTQVIKDILATLHIRINHAGHNVTLDVAVDVKMDSYPGSLGQVITNLIENAILHAFDKGRAGVMTIKVTQPDPQRVLLLFSDNGHGIPAENLKRVFDPFFTTKLGQGGSGLGLHICYNIVTSIMRGQLSVKSTIGAGTTFILDCPLVV